MDAEIPDGILEDALMCAADGPGSAAAWTGAWGGTLSIPEAWGLPWDYSFLPQFCV